MYLGYSPDYSSQVQTWESRCAEDGTNQPETWRFTCMGSKIPQGLESVFSQIADSGKNPIRPYTFADEDVFVHKYNATIVTRNGMIPVDLCDALVPEGNVWNTAVHSYMNRGNTSTCRRFRGHLVVISGAYSNNYFHWLFDTLPRLGKFLSSSEDDCLYLNQYRLFQRETLQLLDIPTEKIISAEMNPHLKVDRLSVPSLPMPPLPAPPSVWRPPVVSEEACVFLRDWLSPAVSSDCETGSWRKIFVMRQGSRAILNWTEMKNVLLSFGFRVVSLESMGVADQIRVFRAAEVIVGVHGAGLANLVFCVPGTLVVELMPTAWRMPYYWSLCKIIKLRYKAMDALSVPNVSGDVSQSSLVLIDLGEFVELINS